MYPDLNILNEEAAAAAIIDNSSSIERLPTRLVYHL